MSINAFESFGPYLDRNDNKHTKLVNLERICNEIVDLMIEWDKLYITTDELKTGILEYLEEVYGS